MFKICYCDDFVKTSKNIVSTFYVEVNGLPFPDKEWTDFPLAVLRMWCKNLESNEDEFKLYFMDGPFLIDCYRFQDRVKMQLVNNRSEKEIEGEFTVRTEELVNSVFESGTNLINLVERKAFGPLNDLKELKKSLKRLNLLLTINKEM